MSVVVWIDLGVDGAVEGECNVDSEGDECSDIRDDHVCPPVRADDGVWDLMSGYRISEQAFLSRNKDSMRSRLWAIPKLLQ